MLLQHRHEHLGVDERAGVKEFHTGNLTTDGHGATRITESRGE
jgi:hypothetical protein